MLIDNSLSLVSSVPSTRKKTSKKISYVKLPDDVKAARSMCKTAFGSWKNHDFPSVGGIHDNYASVNSKPDHPQDDPLRFAHSSCPWGRVFAPLSFPGICPGFSRGGVLNQSKSSIILKRARFLLCLLHKWAAAYFIFLYMLEVRSVTQDPFTL